MESGMPMILPKGIVINTSNIYKEVAEYPVIPAHKIWEYWHVYTTTYKKLNDPTARRLENFWWQVWGSDRRFLSGRIIAKLYEDISEGPTFVPLHGPPNRWEGPGVTPLTKQIIVAHFHRELDTAESRPEAPRTKSNDTALKSLYSSASKPPPAHPILKTSRSPLPTGPKPTARFAPPPKPDDYVIIEDDIPSSGSTATGDLELPTILTSLDPSPRSAASSSASLSAERSRKSQESSSPRVGSTSQALSRGITTPDKHRLPPNSRAVSGIDEAISPAAGNGLDSKGSMQTTSMRSSVKPPLSSKAAGKQPAVSRNVIRDLPALSSTHDRPAISISTAHSQMRGSTPLQSPVLARPMPLSRTDTDNSSTTGSLTDSASILGRPISQNGYARKTSNPGLFTGATATTTNVAVQGQIIDQAGSLPASSVLDPHMDNSGLPSRPSASSLLEARMTPTQPSHCASVPMARTRSQLTLLLERGKTKTDD